MAYNKFDSMAKHARPPAEIAVETFMGFPQGLRTSVPASMLAATELAECVNLQINRGGQLQSRPGMKRLNNNNVGKIISLGLANVGEDVVQFMQTEDFKIYQLDALGDETLVGTAQGKAQIINYTGLAMILDGQYLKYVDSDGVLKLAWDGGSYGQFDNLSEAVTGNTSYTAAQSVKVTFVTPSWLGGFSIAPDKVRVKLARVLTGGTGPITIEIRKTTGDVLVASGPLESLPADLAVEPGDFYIANMTNIVSNFLANTSYYVKIVMPSYSATDYIKWYHGASSIPLCGVSPGAPPKASNGFVYSRRLWLYGNPDAMGRIYFNNYAPFDWTTPDYSGYLSAVDEGKDSYPIGAAMAYYGSVFIYGTKEWPYLLKLTGDSVLDFNLEDLKQPIWTSAQQITNILNDVWALSSAGMISMTGVQMYGDVRTFSESASIEDRIEALWNTDAFTGYYTDRGQLWVCIGGKVYVAHTKAPTEGLNRVQYPWSEYTFPFSISCFSNNEEFAFGTEEGFIYAPDKLATRDDGTKFLMSLRTKYTVSPFQRLDVLESKVLIDSKTGAGFEFVCYKNDSNTEAVNVWLMAAALHDDVTINDLGDALVNDLVMAVDSNATPLVIRLGFVCFSYQVQLRAVNLIGYPVYINGVIMRYRPMED